MTSALDGITVLDLTSYLAGPYGCALLGDMGATVVKIEAPSGDMMRQYPSTLKGENRAFLGANRNKRSIVIDLKNKSGQKTLYRLIQEADVLVHNFRPGVEESLGIGYGTLKELHAGLIYCSLTGYGKRGPLRQHPGYDQMLQCFTGMAKAQGEAMESSPHLLRGSIVDFFSSTLVAFGIASALVHRFRTGEGQHVEISLLRSSIALQVGRFIAAENEPLDVPREPAANRVTGAFPTREGFLYFQSSTLSFWQQLCTILEVPDMAVDPRFDTLKKRYACAEEIMPRLKKALMQRTALEWEALMIGKVPSVAIRGIEDMFDHPQVLAEELVVEHEHPTVGKYRTMTTAVHMGIGSNTTTRAPLLGEHTDEILRDFGFDPGSIEQMRKEGSVS
jgi:crotonobetainyl-CoA:carnitine CoA-transferase CaiB-like acyl-CoA transferase